jgi:hypothetical protein
VAGGAAGEVFCGRGGGVLNLLFVFLLARDLLRRRAIATRTTGPAGKHLRYALRGKFRNSRKRSDSLNFLSPAFAFLEPEVRIGGDSPTAQQAACGGLGTKREGIAF